MLEAKKTELGLVEGNMEEEIGVVLSSMLPVRLGRDGSVTTMPPYNVIIECSDVIGLRPRLQ